MQIMGEYARDQVRRKVSQFILSEAGRVGYRNTLSMAALVTASSLAAMLLAPPRSHAANCGDSAWCTPESPYCCVCANDFYCWENEIEITHEALSQKPRVFSYTKGGV